MKERPGRRRWQGAEFTEPVALAVDVDDRHVMQQAVEDRGGEALVARNDLRWVEAPTPCSS